VDEICNCLLRPSIRLVYSQLRELMAAWGSSGGIRLRCQAGLQTVKRPGSM